MKYPVLAPFKFGDKKTSDRYEVGDVAELPDKAAEQLLADGYIGEAIAADAKPPK